MTTQQEIKLPPHLQAIVDKLNGGAQMIVEDVTPAGYGPDED